MKKFILLLLFALSIIKSTKTFAQINVQDSLALIAFYNSTNGANWFHHTNWLTERPVKSWGGIITKDNRVTGVWLSSNNLSGSIPSEFGDLTNLQSLYLNNNPLISNYSEIGNITNLQSLDLSNNQLTSIPSELENLTNLQILYLNNNQLTGIPPEFGNLANLKYLYLNNNQLISIPPEFGNLANLQYLYLNNNQLINIPPEFGNLTNLQYLYLNNNQFISIPSGFGNLTNLQYLYLNHNQLISISSGFGNLANLQYLYLNNNQLISIPPEFGNLSNLKYLYLDSNQLTSILPELGNLSSLGLLDLSYNDLSGNIPPELGNLSNLGAFYLKYNKLSGSIPPELGNLINLGGLNFSHNKLSGSIPPELGNCSKLREFNLSYNKLTGNIPPELGNFFYLTEFYLNNNNLSGSIPSELSNLNSLQALYLNNNDLSGIIPTSLFSLTWPLDFYFLNVTENQFTFNGMEPFVEESNSTEYVFIFYYAPQAIIPLHNNGSMLSVSAGGELSDNTYRWYKNGELYKKLKADSTLTVTEAGHYFVNVTNAIATDLTLHSDTINFGVLPVSLLSFTAQKQNNTSLLQWQTADEINNSYFNIERSSNLRIFSTIGKVDALNGSNKNSYSFVDNTTLQGINYYRLKQVDKDGAFTYSKIVSTDFIDYSSLFNVSPNPATNEVKITIPKINSVSQLTVYDVSGKKIINEQIAANINSKQINISNLPAGVYNIVLLQDGKQQNLKLIKK